VAYETQSKMVIGYDNKVTPENLSSVSCSVTANSSFPDDNLEYEDPWRMMKVTTTPGSDPDITFTFSSSQTFTCWGLVNHNIITQGYQSINLQYEDSGWNDVGTGISLLSRTTDTNFLLRFGSQSSTQWRIQMTGPGTKPTFYIGSVFMGTAYTVPRNPIDGLMNTRIGYRNTFVDAAGGARYVAQSAYKAEETIEATFERATQSQTQKMTEDIAANNQGKMIALVGPDQVFQSMPGTHGHFYGYARDIVVAPRGGPSSTDHRADIVLTMDSAV